MTPSCEQVLDALPRGALPPPLETHAKDCPDCQASLAAFRVLGARPQPPTAGPLPPALSDFARDAVKRAPRARPWWVEALAAMAVILAMALGMLMAVGARQETGHPLMGWTTAGAILALIAAGTWSALSPRARWLRFASVGLSAVIAVLIVVTATGEGGELPFWGAGAPCTATEIGATLPLLALMLWLLTRSAPAPLKAATAALAGGAAGLFALHLHCPVRTASHLLVFHVVPWVVLALVAIAVRRRLRTRSYAP